MIESRLLREIEERGKSEGRIGAHAADILRLLEARFDHAPEEIRERLSAIQNEATLEDLIVTAYRCPDPTNFRAPIPE